MALETVGAVVTATAEVRRITIENVRGRHLKSHAEVATRVSMNQLVHTNHGSTLRFVTEVPALICHVTLIRRTDNRFCEVGKLRTIACPVKTARIRRLAIHLFSIVRQRKKVFCNRSCPIDLLPKADRTP